MVEDMIIRIFVIIISLFFWGWFDTWNTNVSFLLEDQVCLWDQRDPKEGMGRRPLNIVTQKSLVI